MSAALAAGSTEAALADLPGLGAVSARMLVDAGIADVATLKRLGPSETWRRLRFRHGRRVTANFIYALECAIRGIHWRALEHARKAELREQARDIAAQMAKAAP